MFLAWQRTTGRRGRRAAQKAAAGDGVQLHGLERAAGHTVNFDRCFVHLPVSFALKLEIANCQTEKAGIL